MAILFHFWAMSKRKLFLSFVMIQEIKKSCLKLLVTSLESSISANSWHQNVFDKNCWYDLIILKKIGCKWQANYCVNTHHHSRVIQACEQAANRNTKFNKPKSISGNKIFQSKNYALKEKKALTQSWRWWQCWQCSWRWRRHRRNSTPTCTSPPPGRSRGRRTGLETFLDALGAW